MVQFHQQFCNDIDGLVPAEEGGLIEGWTLQGETQVSIKPSFVKRSVHF